MPSETASRRKPDRAPVLYRGGAPEHIPASSGDTPSVPGPATCVNRSPEDLQFERFRRLGDVAALAAVFDATSPELARVARHLCRDSASAEDAVQSTFLAAIDQHDDWDESQPLLPWLLGVLTNRVREQRRRDGRRLDAERVPLPAAAEDPVAAAGRSEVSTAVRTALGDVEPPYRDVLERRLLGLQSSEEIARELGIAAGTVRMRLHRGLDRLRRRLPAGLAPSTGLMLPLGLSGEAMARVRDAVLTTATSRTVATAGAGSASALPGVALLGWLAMHKTWLFAVAASLVVVTALLLPLPWSSADAPTAHEAPSAAVVARTAPGQESTAEHGSRAPDLDRREVDTPPDVDEIPGSLALTVRGDGTPIADLRIEIVPVEAMPYGDALAAGETDAAGGFVAELAAGTFAVRIPALDEPHVTTVEVTAGERLAADLELPVRTRADVTVVDPEGRPVPGALITGHTAAQRWSRVARALGRTDDEGHWRRTFVDRVSRIRALAAGHVQSDVQWSLDAPVTLVVGAASGRLVGVVRDETGAPVPNAEIALVTAREKHLRAEPRWIRADDAGRFHDDHLPPGTVTLVSSRLVEQDRVTFPRFTRLDVEIAAGEATRAELRFGDGTGSVRATVRSANGVPVPAAPISLVYVGRDLPSVVGGTPQAYANADSNGEARFTGLMPGAYRLQCPLDGQQVTCDFAVVANTTVEISASLVATSPLTCRVLDAERRPLPGILLSLASARSPQAQELRSDTHGLVRFEDVPHGEHGLRVFAARQADERPRAALMTRSVSITGPSNEEIVVDLDILASVSGRVTTDGRVPLEGIEARLMRQADSATFRAPVELDAFDSARFTFPSVPPGHWVLGLYGGEENLAARSVDVPGRTPVDLGTLALGTGTTELELSRSDAVPVDDAIVLVRFGTAPLREIPNPPQSNRIRLADRPALEVDEALVWGSSVAPTPIELRIVPGETLRIPVTLAPATPTTLRMPVGVGRGTLTWTRDGAPFVIESVAGFVTLSRGLPVGRYQASFEEKHSGLRATAAFEVGDAPLEVALEVQ